MNQHDTPIERLRERAAEISADAAGRTIEAVEVDLRHRPGAEAPIAAVVVRLDDGQRIAIDPGVEIAPGRIIWAGRQWRAADEGR